MTLWVLAEAYEVYCCYKPLNYIHVPLSATLLSVIIFEFSLVLRVLAPVFGTYASLLADTLRAIFRRVVLGMDVLFNIITTIRYWLAIINLSREFRSFGTCVERPITEH